MAESIDRKAEPSSALRPPPLFRSIGPPGPLASMPPHRRLRSLFCRSRAVLPANTHTVEASNTHSFTDIEPGTHVQTVMCSEVQSSTLLNALEPEVDSGVLTDMWSLVSKYPQAQTVQQDRQFSHYSSSAATNGRNRGRQARLVTPLQTTEDPAIKGKQQQKRRKRRGGKQKYVVPSVTEKEEDARLCEWLQSLGFAHNCTKDSTSNQERIFVSRCSAVTTRKDPDSSHTRDRRPHFLPPICQSESLLHVPLLIPGNSPPPSPCTHPDTPVHSLPLPMRQRLSLRRKLRTNDGKSLTSTGLEALLMY